MDLDDLMTLARRLVRSTAATTSLEFALVGPLAIMILLVGVDLGYSMFLKSMFNEALIEGARWSAAGNTSLKNNGKWADLMAVIAEKTALVPNVYAKAYNGSQVGAGTAVLPSSISSLCQSGTGQGGSSDAALGGPGDIVGYCLSYNDPILGPLKNGALMLVQSSNLNIVVTTIARNEPLS